MPSFRLTARVIPVHDIVTPPLACRQHLIRIPIHLQTEMESISNNKPPRLMYCISVLQSNWYSLYTTSAPSRCRKPTIQNCFRNKSQKKAPRHRNFPTLKSQGGSSKTGWSGYFLGQNAARLPDRPINGLNKKALSTEWNNPYILPSKRSKTNGYLGVITSRSGVISLFKPRPLCGEQSQKQSDFLSKRMETKKNIHFEINGLLFWLSCSHFAMDPEIKSLNFILNV